MCMGSLKFKNFILRNPPTKGGDQDEQGGVLVLAVCGDSRGGGWDCSGCGGGYSQEKKTQAEVKSNRVLETPINLPRNILETLWKPPSNTH